jgi:hypothetical protein
MLYTGDAYDNIDTTLKNLNIQGKDLYLNTLEKFHVYKTKKTGILHNENYADTHDPIFELLL